jgi:hypothetical protein
MGYPLNSLSREDTRISRHTLLKFRTDETTGLNEFSLGILANNNQVDILGALASQGAFYSG